MGIIKNKTFESAYLINTIMEYINFINFVRFLKHFIMELIEKNIDFDLSLHSNLKKVKSNYFKQIDIFRLSLNKFITKVSFYDVLFR